MFKYIADIISKISVKQRLTALGIVLLSIVVISVAPKLISGLTQDNEELKLKVERQRTEIVNLSTRVNELNEQIMSNQSVCTERFVAREKEILDMLIGMEGEAQRNHNKVVSTSTSSVDFGRTLRMERKDGSGSGSDEGDGEVSAMMIRETPQVTTVVKTDNSSILKMVRGMKKNVEQNINENKSH
jgi:hypothetical protein